MSRNAPKNRQKYWRKTKIYEEEIAFLRTWKCFERNSKKIIEFACRMT